MDELRQIITFLQEAERLKFVERCAWTSTGGKESTAEHSWRLALLAALLLEKYPSLDGVKVLRMCLIHDIGEIYYGDVSAALRPDTGEKYRQERLGAEKVFSLLPREQGAALMDLWEEYNRGDTPEARLVKALDKAETIVQHNQGSDPGVIDFRFNYDYGREYFVDDPLLERLRLILDEGTEEHIQ